MKDMFQKSQLKMGGDFGLEPKTLKAVNALTKNLMLTLIALALFLGACQLAATGASYEHQALLGAAYAFGAVGFGLMVYVFFSVRKN